MVAAANCQLIEIPAQQSTAILVGELATDILTFNRRLTMIGKHIHGRFLQHPLAKNILSIPGFGPLLAAELLVHTNGMREYASAAKLARAAS